MASTPRAPVMISYELADDWIDVDVSVDGLYALLPRDGVYDIVDENEYTTETGETQAQTWIRWRRPQKPIVTAVAA
jgi:hypothetical protein